MKHIIDTDELEKLPKFYENKGAIDTGIVMWQGEPYVKLSDLRALIASSPQADGMVLALNNAELQKRISVLEDLLSSAYNIANRNGENTHWERFAGQLHINGISPITAKTFKILPSDRDYKPAHPPASVPLEKYNKLLSDMKLAYKFRNEPTGLKALLEQAIAEAEAEGKEG